MNDDANESALLDQAESATERRSTRPGKLTREQKTYVVRRLAAYDRPAEIARDLRRQFGIEITRQAIEQYDPTKGSECPEEWAELFRNARKDYMGDTADRAGKSRRVERIVLRTIEVLADRILKGVDAEGRQHVHETAGGHHRRRPHRGAAGFPRSSAGDEPGRLRGDPGRAERCASPARRDGGVAAAASGEAPHAA